MGCHRCRARGTSTSSTRLLLVSALILAARSASSAQDANHSSSQPFDDSANSTSTFEAVMPMHSAAAAADAGSDAGVVDAAISDASSSSGAAEAADDQAENGTPAEPAAGATPFGAVAAPLRTSRKQSKSKREKSGWDASVRSVVDPAAMVMVSLLVQQRLFWGGQK